MTTRLLMTADAVGGVWTYATELAAGLAAHGFETTIAVVGPAPEPHAHRAAALLPGVEVIDTGLPLDWLSDAAGARRSAGDLAALAARLRVDLVHLNSPALGAMAEWPLPLVGVAHGCLAAWWQAARPSEPLPDDMVWHRQKMAAGLDACARVIAPSRAFAERIHALYALRERPHVVHNGRTWRELRQPSPPAPFVLTAGRLWDEVKNTPLLDDVASRLPFRFEAAGPLEGPQGQRTEVRHLAAIGNLAPEALVHRMAERPIFVSAASFEPFGLAVLEAAASGCALVLSDIPTFRELWDGAAQFVPVGDAAELARRLDWLMTHPRQRLALGERGRKRAARYSVARMAAAMAHEYRAALRSSRPARSVRRHPASEQAA